MVSGSHGGDSSADGDAKRPDLEALIRADYERCHPEDSLEDLKRRACFSEEDRGLLGDWMALAASRAKARRSETPARTAAG
jgi:hypothetical protein